MRIVAAFFLVLFLMAPVQGNAQTTDRNIYRWDYRVAIHHAGKLRYTSTMRSINWAWIRTRVNLIQQRDTRRRRINVYFDRVRTRTGTRRPTEMDYRLPGMIDDPSDEPGPPQMRER